MANSKITALNSFSCLKLFFLDEENAGKVVPASECNWATLGLCSIHGGRFIIKMTSLLSLVYSPIRFPELPNKLAWRMFASITKIYFCQSYVVEGGQTKGYKGSSREGVSSLNNVYLQPYD